MRAVGARAVSRALPPASALRRAQSDGRGREVDDAREKPAELLFAVRRVVRVAVGAEGGVDVAPVLVAENVFRDRQHLVLLLLHVLPVEVGELLDARGEALQ